MASKLRVDHIEPVNGVPTGGGGGIIQVTSNTYTATDNNEVGAATWWRTNASCSITPHSSTSKILVFGHVSTSVVGPQYNIGTGIYRGTSTLISDALGDAASNRGRVHTATEMNTSADAMVTVSLNYLDSPATTSAVTYYVGIRNPSSATRFCYINRGVTDTDSTYYPRGTTTLTLFEISA